MDSRLIDIFVSSFAQILIPGLTMTIPLTVISFSFALIIAIITATVQYAKIKILKDIVRLYIWITRGTPVLVQLYVVFYGLPSLGLTLDPFLAAVIVFSLNEGAYASETIRAALEAIPDGQREAGLSLGFNFFQVMTNIIYPEALRIAFPSLFNSLIGMVKDTSLAANITVLEMFMATQRIVARTYEPLLLYIEVALIYLIFCTVLTKLQSYGEKKISKNGETV